MQRYQGEKPKLSSSEINRWNIASDSVSLGRAGLTELSQPHTQESHWVWIRNDSGNDRERYEILSLGDPIFEMMDDGTTDLMFTGEASDPEKTAAILLEPIAQGEMGKAVIHGLALAWVAGGSGDGASVDDTTHRLKAGGDISVLGPIHATDEKLLPVLMGVGGKGVARQVQGTLQTLRTESGVTVGLIQVAVAPEEALIGTFVDVYDHSGCILDRPIADLFGAWIFASEGRTATLDTHWTATNRCCVAADV